ncbi:hypothetical protein GBAR_LOCUS28595, partial [Geodia barretti]
STLGWYAIIPSCRHTPFERSRGSHVSILIYTGVLIVVPSKERSSKWPVVVRPWDSVGLLQVLLS